MKKRLISAASIILCICLMFTQSNCALADNDRAAAKAKAQEALAAAQKEKEELEGALADAEALVSSIQSAKSASESKLSSLNSQVSSLNANISKLEGQLTDLTSQIEAAEEDLQEAQETADAQYEAMKKRIQYVYENGNTNYMVSILSAQDFASMLNALEYVSMLTSYDRNMLEEYQNTVAEAQALKEELEAEKENVKTTQESIGIQKQAVTVLQTAQAQEVSQLGEDLADAQAEAEMYEQEVKAQTDILSQIQAQIEAMNKEETYISSGIFAWPCPSYKYVSSEYGPRTAPTTGASTTHKGIDLAAPYGSNILAVEAGKVATAAYSSSAGNYIIINHGTDSSGNVVCTVYMHCSALYVSAGDVVSRGQTIAAVGSTGVSTGNHLHFGVTVNGSYTSPWNYVSKP